MTGGGEIVIPNPRRGKESFACARKIPRCARNDKDTQFTQYEIRNTQYEIESFTYTGKIPRSAALDIFAILCFIILQLIIGWYVFPNVCRSRRRRLPGKRSVL